MVAHDRLDQVPGVRTRFYHNLPLHSPQPDHRFRPLAVVLVLGLAHMMKGGSASVSQRLMRLRVLLQFTAIVLIMGVVWWRSA